MVARFQEYATSIIGVLVTVSLTLISDFVLGLPREITWLTFFIGAIVTVAITLLEQKLLSSMYSTLERQYDFVRLLYRGDPWLQERILDVINSLERFNSLHPIFIQFSRTKIQELRNLIVEAASGSIYLDATDYHLLAILIDEAKRQVKAISLVPLTWWKGPAGQMYLEKNIAAIKRGVKITRIFIYDEIDRELDALIHKMNTNGIEVRVARLNDVPEELQTDVSLSDDSLVSIVQYTPLKAVGGHRFSSKPEDVENVVMKFEKLLWFSESYDDFAKRPHHASKN